MTGSRRRIAVAAAAVTMAVAMVILGVLAVPGSPHSRPRSHVAGIAAGAPTTGTPICGQPALNAPWNYDGSPGMFSTSGTPAGLPTFGSAGTDFPSATSVLVVAAGNNTTAAGGATYEVNNTVVYFEPGEHVIQGLMYTGHNSAYVGGYTVSAGKTVIDGVNGATVSGNGGSVLSWSTPSSGTTVDDTWEYLTIQNYTASQNNSIMGNNGSGTDDGDIYKYDTIGPNEYGYAGPSSPPRTGESNGGGYAIDAGSNTVIEYDCLTQDAQGAFNGSVVANVRIDNNEISWDGLGEYPDTAGPGASPYACGCSGGGKLFYSLNTNIVNNWIHDNYNTGIWLDFDNDGADISHNYIASNWGNGVEYEASYNASISDNTLTGNGWASDGAWPAGVGGLACYGGVPCTNGAGPISGAGGGFPYSAIYLPNSGGNASLNTVSLPAGGTENSNYSGKLMVQGNVLKDNFGGVMVYSDDNRYPGNIDNDSACSVPLGALNQSNSATYYQTTKILTTNADTSITGNAVTSTAGTTTICSNYSGGSHGGGQSNITQAPSAGMAVYDQNSGHYLGNVATVTSANAFTLTGSPGNETGASLVVSAYGGCGPADYYSGGLNTQSGTPAAYYWDNCIWGSRNVTVTGNSFSTSSSTVTGCTTTANLCGYMTAIAFNAGVPLLMQFWVSYPTYAAYASGGLGNAWSGNAYTWTGTGSWLFEAGLQGHQVTQSQWQSSPYGQDAGSTF